MNKGYGDQLQGPTTLMTAKTPQTPKDQRKMRAGSGTDLSDTPGFGANLGVRPCVQSGFTRRRAVCASPFAGR
jgi:hypothetical protein